MSKKNNRTRVIEDWHAADRGLWGSTPDTEHNALACFCAATDAVVADCDCAGMRDLAEPIASYKQELLAARDCFVGKVYPSIREALRDLATATTLARRKCLGSLDRLLAIPVAGGSGRDSCGTKTISKIATALAVLSDHPDWTNQQIAQTAGCNVKYLSQSQKFKAARQAVRGLGRESCHKSGRRRGSNMDEYEDDEG